MTGQWVSIRALKHTDHLISPVTSLIDDYYHSIQRPLLIKISIFSHLRQQEHQLDHLFLFLLLLFLFFAASLSLKKRLASCSSLSLSLVRMKSQFETD